MRIREILAEYDRSMTLKSWEQKLTSRMASDESAPDTIDQLMEMIESADPTRNKIYAQWIVKRYVAGDYNASELDQVNLRLTDYDSVKRVLTTGKDINQLTYAQLPDIITAGKAQKTAPKFEVIPDTEVLYNGPDGQLAIPKTEEASRELGKGTAWCTAWTDRATLFNEYNASGKLYTWRAKNGDKFQFYWGEKTQFMNSANKPLSPKDMHFFRSINPPTKKLFAKYEDEFLKSNNKKQILALLSVLAKSQTTWEKGLELIGSDPESAYSYAKWFGISFPAGEAAIATNAEYSYEYARMLNTAFPEGEPAIATNAEYSYKYATKILKGKPFPEGEPAIATSAKYSYYYALEVRRFPEGEPAIATDAHWSYMYAYDVLKKTKFPAGEIAIAKDAKYSYLYAVDILGNRFPEGEAAIATDKTIMNDYKVDVVNKYAYKNTSITSNPKKAYEYAMEQNKRFPEGEKAISTSSKYSYLYALYVMQRRPFPLGEPAIARNADIAFDYAKTILERRFPAGEPAIATSAEYSYKYARQFSQPFPAGEVAIATSAEYSYQYAEQFSQPFPAGEAAIATSAEYSYQYAKMLGKAFPLGEKAIATSARYSFNYAKMLGKAFPLGEKAIVSQLRLSKEYDEMFGTNLAQR